MGSCTVWLYGLWSLGLGEASNSSLVKVNKNPKNPNSQRAGLLPLASPSFSCQCPGSPQPFLSVPKHPLPWSQQGHQQRCQEAAWRKENSGCNLVPLASSSSSSVAPSWLVFGSNHPSPKSICACHQWEWLQSSAI